MASKIIEEVENLVTPYAKSLDLNIADIEYEKKFNGMNLTIFISKDGGVTINDCEKLHKLINDPLDELNPTNDKPYILNVSSLGLDRPLKTSKDFKRNIGKMIEIKFYAPIDGQKKTEGILTDYNNNSITIKQNDHLKDIMLSDAAKITLQINF